LLKQGEAKALFLS